MTNRQSNIIFYSVISLIIYALVLNYFKPEFFANFSKSKDERSIQAAMDKGEHRVALTRYQQMVADRITNNNENNVESADIYEAMAKLYFLLGEQVEEKKYYLKSLKIKEALKKVNRYSLANTYEKLATFAEADEHYDQAQMYYEKSLSKRLGATKEDDEGMFVGLMNSRKRYLNLNNELTIVTFKNLANIHTLKKEKDIAKSYYEKALEASKLTFGEDDTKTIEIKNLINQLSL